MEMKYFIVCSTAFYDKIPEIADYLKEKGYEVMYPNGYLEDDYEIDDDISDEEYYAFFRRMFLESKEKAKECDAVVVLNYTKIKNGQEYPNYIGASTFLEMYEAFMADKKIYMLNGYPDNMLYDEIKGFKPIILDGDINNLK